MAFLMEPYKVRLGNPNKNTFIVPTVEYFCSIIISSIVTVLIFEYVFR